MKKLFYRVLLFVSILVAGGLVAVSWWTIEYTNDYIVEVDAQGILTPFGDAITQVSYECCYGHIVTIDDIVGQQQIDLMYYWGASQLYEEYQIWSSGPLTVGNYFPIGICLEIDEECESVSITDGSIVQVGTSQQ